MSDTANLQFWFDVHVTVHLEDGSTPSMRLDVPVEAPSEDVARGYLKSVATEVCHDEGSNWFDAPVSHLDDDMRVLRVWRG
jgi:hypothetical protein